MNDELSKIRRKHQLYRDDKIYVVEAKRYVYIYIPYVFEARIEKEACRKICSEIIDLLTSKLGVSL